MTVGKFDHRQVLILGAGASGVAAARLALTRSCHVILIDEQWDQSRLAQLACEGISCATAPHADLLEGNFDLIVTSPSIPMEHPWIARAKIRGIHVISELEFAAAYWQGESIAITGSKGKSSVVKCLAETLTQAGRPAYPAGNYGTPLSELVLQLPAAGRGTTAVVEVSSFQMEHTETFAPHIAAILNVQADHLDRHHTMAAYVAEKRKLFQAQKADRGDLAFLPCDFSEGNSIPPGVRIERFGSEPYALWQYQSGKVQHGADTYTISGYFDNVILGRAVALIVGILVSLGLTRAQIETGLSTFQPLPHRMQVLGKKRGVSFIDDSKATSLSAMAAAIQMVQTPIRLIAGGLLKEADLHILDSLLQTRVKKVYLIGQASEALYNAWSPLVPCEPCNVMSIAVRQAYAEATVGETILLSPGTASFDQYSGMSARGKDFEAQFLAL